MTRLSAYLDGRLPGRRQLRALCGGFIATLRGARIAENAQTWRRETTALRAESFASYCARVRPAAAATTEVLLAEPKREPGIWSGLAQTSGDGPCRIVTMDGIRQPWFATTPPTYPVTRQAYLRVRSAVVYPRPGLVVAEPGVALRNNLLRWYPDHRLTPGFVDFVDGRLVAEVDALHPRGHIRPTVLLLCHAFHRNYAVWLLDCLPILMPWRDLLRQGRLAILVPPLTDWQRRTLQLLGVPASAIIVAQEPSVLCDDVIIPGLLPVASEPTAEPVEPAIDPATESISHDLRQPGAAVIETIQLLRNGIHPTPGTTSPEYVYVSRRGTDSFRQLTNEDEVEEAMRQLGFAVVRTEELSFDDQVATFARARIIAGPNGAGLNNIVFAPAGCLLLDLCADSWPNSLFVRTTQLFDHHYLPLEFPSDAARAQPILLGNAIIGQTHFYAAQIDTLTAALQGAMRRLGMERSRGQDDATSLGTI
ncbi:MAG: glycosyltransferase 61 family protein [Xanthobacteraceae bacterium]|nr:glycosyltransferase 61 family protein [Xanthobacteraceae bacterium]